MVVFYFCANVIEVTICMHALPGAYSSQYGGTEGC